MSAQLRVAARAGDVDGCLRLLDGKFKGSNSSRRLDGLRRQLGAILAEQQRKHRADPENVPETMTLEALSEAYRRAVGRPLRAFDFGFRVTGERKPEALVTALAPPPSGGGPPTLLESLADTCVLSVVDGATYVRLASSYNSQAYNIAG